MIIISLGNYRVVLVTREFLLFSQTLYGDVAQLARVLDWQSRGRGFESHLLHKLKTLTLNYQVIRVCFLLV